MGGTWEHKDITIYNGDWAPRCPGVQAPSLEQESRTIWESWGRGRRGKPSLTWQISDGGGRAGTPVQGQMSGPPQIAVALAARWPPLPPVRALPSPSPSPGEGGKPPDLLPHPPAPSCCLLAHLPPGVPARHLHRTLPHCYPAPRLPSPSPPWCQHMQSPLPGARPLALPSPTHPHWQPRVPRPWHLHGLPVPPGAAALGREWGPISLGEL